MRQEVGVHGRVQSRHRSWDRDRPAIAKLCEASQPLKQKAGYKANGSLLIAFFSLGFRVSRALIQAMY
jgi:hypothetical protein